MRRALLSYALQGYLPTVASLANTVPGSFVRSVLVLAGVLLAAPELISSLFGIGLTIATYGVLRGSARIRTALVAATLGDDARIAAMVGARSGERP